MAEFHKLLARLKGALEKPQAPTAHENHPIDLRNDVRQVMRHEEYADT